MKKIIVTAFAIGIMMPLTAHAGYMYTTVNGGWGKLTDSTFHLPVGFVAAPKHPIDVGFNSGLLISGGIGYDFGNIRAEGVIQYQKNQVNTLTIPGYWADGGGHVTNESFMLNGYYDISPHSRICPFFTAGVGVDRVKVINLSAWNNTPSAVNLGSSDDTVFAWQVGAGLAFAVSEQASVDITYRYFGTSSPDFDGVSAEIGSNDITLGLRVNFF